MCGIAGIFAYSEGTPNVLRQELSLISEAMYSRGPDAKGVWLSPDARIGFAHRRLSIIDLSDAGAQPMHTRDGRYSIVFNGEIYNYRHLKRSLESRGYRFNSESDTEVLLQLYSAKSEAMLEELRGMFAFAIWDQENRSLTIARDRFGIKPLYYSDDGGTFRFASQVKALLAGRRIDTSPDPAGHVGFFVWGHVPEPHTLYRRIRSLPAGSSLIISRRGPQPLRKYFEVSQLFADAESMARDGPTAQKDAAAIIHTALSDSVEHHNVADVPVGLFLSSGIDSTSIATTITEVRRNASTLSTITLACTEYRGTRFDESVLAERTAQALGCDQKTIWLSKTDFQNDLERLVAAMDQPSIDGANSYFVSKAAKVQALKVAMSGLGADEIFGGYPSFSQVPRLMTAVSMTPFGNKLSPFWNKMSSTLFRRTLSPKFASIFEYGSTLWGAYLLRRALFMPWELFDFLDPDLVKTGWQELHTLDALKQTTSGIKTTHLKISALELSWYMRNQLLRDTDWASMAHSIEVRVPFVDHILLKAMAQLAACNRISSKRPLISLLPDSLRAPLQGRTKSGFDLPIREWLLDAGSVTAERGLRGWARFIHRLSYGSESLGDPPSKSHAATAKWSQAYDESSCSR